MGGGGLFPAPPLQAHSHSLVVISTAAGATTAASQATTICLEIKKDSLEK